MPRKNSTQISVAANLQMTIFRIRHFFETAVIYSGFACHGCAFGYRLDCVTSEDADEDICGDHGWTGIVATRISTEARMHSRHAIIAAVLVTFLAVQVFGLFGLKIPSGASLSSDGLNIRQMMIAPAVKELPLEVVENPT